MAESVVLSTKARSSNGTQKARQLRRTGLVPAVVYGHKEATVSVALPGEELFQAIRHGTRVLDLKVAGATQAALITEVQWDHLGKEILHVDFIRVDKDERIRVHVPIELKGIAPGSIGGGAECAPDRTGTFLSGGDRSPDEDHSGGPGVEMSHDFISP